jgi:hypothetical protein
MPPRKSKKVKRKVKRKLKRIQHAAPPIYPGRMIGSARPPDMGWTQAVIQPSLGRAEPPPLPVMDFSSAKFNVPTKMLPLTYTPGAAGPPEDQQYKSKLKSQDRIDQIRFGKMRELQHAPSLPAWKSPEAVPPPEPDMSIPEGKPQSLFHNRDIHMPDVPVYEDEHMRNPAPKRGAEEDLEEPSGKRQKQFVSKLPLQNVPRMRPSEYPPVQIDPAPQPTFGSGPFTFNPAPSKWHRESVTLPSVPPTGFRYEAPQESTQVAARHFGQPEKRKAEEITLSKLDRQRDHATVQIAKKSSSKTKKSRTV